jgi:hypothetical protein
MKKRENKMRKYEEKEKENQPCLSSEGKGC